MPERNVHSSAQAITASSGKSGRVKASSCGPSIPVKRHTAGFARVEPEGAQPRGGAGQRDGVLHPREQKKSALGSSSAARRVYREMRRFMVFIAFPVQVAVESRGQQAFYDQCAPAGQGGARQTAHARKGGDGHAAGIVPSGTRHIQPRRRTRLYPPDQHAHR